MKFEYKEDIMKIIFTVLICVLSINCWADIICNAQDSGNSSMGSFYYDRSSGELKFETDLKEETLFDLITICGELIGNTQPIPNCNYRDESYDEVVRYSISCDQTFGNSTTRLYSVGTFWWNTRNGQGLFSCKTIRNKNYKFSLRDCTLKP